MIEQAVEEFQKYLNNSDKKELFNEPKKVSLQVCFHKIPNLISEKHILCKLPHSLNPQDNLPEVCLIVKDVDKEDRDYEKTIRKYKKIVEKNGLNSIIKQIMPLKQLNLEFRPFETKRKLSTSFDLFLADKCLHDILFNGSKLGKEFNKRKRMPVDIDIEGEKDLKETVMNILSSTFIRLNGKGIIIDINAFLSTHTVEQAIENINVIKAELFKHLPGGESNVKSMFIKSTDSPAVPIYADVTGNMNQVKIKNNMTPGKINRAKKLNVKRLKKSAQIKTKAKARAEKKARKVSTEKNVAEKIIKKD